MLTILMRTSYRPESFRQAFKSLLHVADDVRIVYDDLRAKRYLNEYVHHDRTRYVGGQYPQIDFWYNRYCNDLLQFAPDEGHYLFLDDDDEMIQHPSIPETLKVYLNACVEPGHSYIVPFLRGDFQKPLPIQIKKKQIVQGYIGLPCLILWHEHKKLINFDDSETADYKAIKQLSEQAELKWLKHPLVQSLKRNYGSKEII